MSLPCDNSFLPGSSILVSQNSVASFLRRGSDIERLEQFLANKTHCKCVVSRTNWAHDIKGQRIPPPWTSRCDSQKLTETPRGGFKHATARLQVIQFVLVTAIRDDKQKTHHEGRIDWSWLGLQIDRDSPEAKTNNEVK